MRRETNERGPRVERAREGTKKRGTTGKKGGTAALPDGWMDGWV